MVVVQTAAAAAAPVAAGAAAAKAAAPAAAAARLAAAAARVAAAHPCWHCTCSASYASTSGAPTAGGEPVCGTEAACSKQCRRFLAAVLVPVCNKHKPQGTSGALYLVVRALHSQRGWWALAGMCTQQCTVASRNTIQTFRKLTFHLVYMF